MNAVTFIINGQTIKEKSKIEDSFNKYFVNIGPQLAKDIPSSSRHPLSYLSNPKSSTIFLQPVLAEEVEDIVKNLHNSSLG
jgi:hypothetical protein